jgi:hypothetical protein
LSLAQARKVYGISGGETVTRWLRQIGKNHLRAQIVRVEVTDETSHVRQLEKEKQRLESALAQAHLKILTLESTLEVLEEKSGMSVKKKTDATLSKPLFNDKPGGTSSSRS